MKKIPCFLAAAFWLLAVNALAQTAKPPVRFAIVGLEHDHALGFIPRLRDRPEVQLVGITGVSLIKRIPISKRSR